MEVPGHKKGLLAAGYETTYDRLRTISPVSIIQIPLYNTYPRKDELLGTFTGFEADGMMMGFRDCDDYSHVDYSFWNSTEINGAADFRPELCPLGKYGYDARCRGWYANGKKIWEESGTSIYCMPPYLFAGNGKMGQSCSSPLFDPNTRKYIGQTLIDFLPQSIIDSLKEDNQLTEEGFPILISTQVGSFCADTIVGPGFNIGDPDQPIEELVLPHEMHKCSGLDLNASMTNMQDEGLSELCRSVWSDFNNITGRMRAGKSGLGCFTRTTEDGGNENIFIFYAPVTAETSLPMNSSDFSRGTQESKTQIFSLALLQPELSVTAPYQAVNVFINKQVNIFIGVVSALIFVVAVVVVFISFRVSETIITPVMHLLMLVQQINR